MMIVVDMEAAAVTTTGVMEGELEDGQELISEHASSFYFIESNLHFLIAFS